MTAENKGAFKKQSSTSWPVVNTSTQVGSNENVHSQDRSCSEPGRHSTLLGSSGEYTFKRLKLNHMVPSGFPIVYWHRGEAKLSQQRANGRKAGILMSIREGSLSLKPKEIRYSSVKGAGRGVQRGREPGRNTKKDLRLLVT